MSIFITFCTAVVKQSVSSLFQICHFLLPAIAYSVSLGENLREVIKYDRYTYFFTVCFKYLVLFIKIENVKIQAKIFTSLNISKVLSTVRPSVKRYMDNRKKFLVKWSLNFPL